MKRFLSSLLFSVLAIILVIGCSNPASDTVKSSNADLSGLIISSGSLSPRFDAGTTVYTVNVPNTTTAITVTGTAADVNATLSANNGVSHDLSNGSNAITIRVTAQDGTTKDYVVTVNRLSFSLTMISVPGGTYQDNYTPPKTYTVSDFRMSQCEITREQFLEVMGTDPSDVNYSGGVTDPVQMINWYHAVAFCNKLSIAEGLTPVYEVSGVDFSTLAYADIPLNGNLTWNGVIATLRNTGYRLPTEIEWRWAAMGATKDRTNGNIGTGTNTTGIKKSFAGSTGNNTLGDYAVFGYGSNDSGRTMTQRTNPVGSKKSGANELGLYDMSGNVMEWLWGHIILGGAWDSFYGYCTVISSDPCMNPHGREYHTGFRVACPSD